MAISPQQFEQGGSKVFEADVERIGEEVERRKERPEYAGTNEKEVVREAVQAVVTPIQSSDDDDDEDASGDILPEYTNSASPEAKLEIEHFVEMALREGILKAHREAKKSHPYILDAFHDTLSGTVHDALKKRGKL